MKRSYYPIFEQLLAAGANYLAVMGGNMRAFHLAAAQKYHNILKKLLASKKYALKSVELIFHLQDFRLT